MRLISLRAHGAIDYTVGLLSIALPYLLGFSSGGPKHWIPVLYGVLAISYSLFTRYPFGAVKVIPMHVHLVLDLAASAFVAISPWAFRFSSEVYAPHLFLGILGITVALSTRRLLQLNSSENANTIA